MRAPGCVGARRRRHRVGGGHAPPRGSRGRAPRRRPRSCAGCRASGFSARPESRSPPPPRRPRRRSRPPCSSAARCRSARASRRASPAKARSAAPAAARPARGPRRAAWNHKPLSARMVGSIPCRNGKPAACCAATCSSPTWWITRPKPTIGLSVLPSSCRIGVMSPQASPLRGMGEAHATMSILGSRAAVSQSFGGDLDGRGNADVERILRRDAVLHQRQQRRLGGVGEIRHRGAFGLGVVVEQVDGARPRW